MIKIKYNLENGVTVLERELTSDEKKTITSQKIDGATNEVIFYQSDEPKEILIETKTREVAAWRVRAILKGMGLLSTIDNAIATLTEPTKSIAETAWEYSPSINKYSPTTQLIQQACGLTDEQVEEIFTNAENIPV